MTIIITTSPVRSNPSTLLLEETISTFHQAGPEFQACKKILVCDGYKNKGSQENPCASKRVGTDKSKMRVGIVNDEQQINYEQFKMVLGKKIDGADSRSIFHNTELLELKSRHGTCQVGGGEGGLWRGRRGETTKNIG